MNNFLKYEEIQSSEIKASEYKSLNTAASFQDINIGDELDILFPPQTVTEESELKTFHACRKQATLFEICELKNYFDSKLKELENEESGFSDKLRDIYFKLFDELIRQEIIACPERGLLLVSVRNEALKTMTSMQKLYRSCFAFAITKDLLSQKDIIKKRQDIPKFIHEINRANETLQSMRKEWEEKKRREEEAEHIKMIERTFVENQLIIANQQMVNQIEDVIDSEHKWLKDED